MTSGEGPVFDAVSEGSRREILDLLGAGRGRSAKIADRPGSASRTPRAPADPARGRLSSAAEGQRRIYELRPRPRRADRWSPLPAALAGQPRRARTPPRHRRDEGSHARPARTLQEVDGRPALRFRTGLPHRRSGSWKALTEPAEMFAWHPTPAASSAVAAGRLGPEGPRRRHARGRGTSGPPRLLAYYWPTWRPRTRPPALGAPPHDDGCVLTLIHSLTIAQAARTAG